MTENELLWDLGLEEWDYHKLLRFPQWRQRSKSRIAQSPRCNRCGKTKGLQVHHLHYHNDGRSPWDYEDEELEVLCRRCHRQADRERIEEESECRNFDEHSAENRYYNTPKGINLDRFLKHQVEFETWVSAEKVAREDWGSWPLWYFWNCFGEESLKHKQALEQAVKQLEETQLLLKLPMSRRELPFVGTNRRKNRRK